MVTMKVSKHPLYYTVVCVGSSPVVSTHGPCQVRDAARMSPVVFRRMATIVIISSHQHPARPRSNRSENCDEGGCRLLCLEVDSGVRLLTGM